MHFGISCPPLPGHINPMVALARELQSRGHRLTFVGFPDMGPKLPGDLSFVSFGDLEWPLGSLQPYLDRLARLGGPLSIHRLMQDLAAFTDTICTQLPAALHRLNPDALIIDQTDAAGSLVATALSIPFVNIANALPLNIEPGVPPPVLPWAYDPSPAGIRRNIAGYRVARIIERPITKAIRRQAKRLGRSDIRFADETWSKRAQISQCVRQLDFPRAQLPDNFHYVGPLRGAEADLCLDLPADGRPLVFCSLGTLQGSRVRLFRAVASAVAKLPVNLLIAHGGMLSAQETARFAGQPMVHGMVNQRAVLSRSALAITHCGFNTVLDGLSFGVPLVGLPITFEQPATGARIKRAGVGEILQHRRTAGRIRTAVETVLGTPSYTENAARLASEIAAAGGVKKAAEIIERATGASPPVIATTGPAAPDDVRDGSRNGSS